jgi:hypothetical protein
VRVVDRDIGVPGRGPARSLGEPGHVLAVELRDDVLPAFTDLDELPAEQSAVEGARQRQVAVLDVDPRRDALWIGPRLCLHGDHARTGTGQVLSAPPDALRRRADSRAVRGSRRAEGHDHLRILY